SISTGIMAAPATGPRKGGATSIRREAEPGYTCPLEVSTPDLPLPTRRPSQPPLCGCGRVLTRIVPLFFRGLDGSRRFDCFSYAEIIRHGLFFLGFRILLQ